MEPLSGMNVAQDTRGLVCPVCFANPMVLGPQLCLLVPDIDVTISLRSTMVTSLILKENITMEMKLELNVIEDTPELEATLSLVEKIKNSLMYPNVMTKMNVMLLNVTSNLQNVKTCLDHIIANVEKDLVPILSADQFWI